MKIIIVYDSSWRNSFLDGNNNEKLPKKGRKFICSMTNLNKKSGDSFMPRTVTLDTVMGVLNRLIGDQQKLYQARSEEYGQYYFKEIEPLVKFTDKPKITSEVTYIRNITPGTFDQNSFTGMIKTNDVMFASDYSTEFWGVLSLDFAGLCGFIVNDQKVKSMWQADPLTISMRFAALGKEKAVDNEGLINKALKVLDTSFPGTNYLNNKGKVVPVNLYCSSLYLQFERLADRFDMSSVLSPRGGITGISKRIFTKKDFMNRFTTGEKKKIWGNPYMRKEFVEGEGKVVRMMTKASGQLEVEILVDREKALEIKNMIQNAGVSSFYLGKKGLAYVSEIWI